MVTKENISGKTKSISASTKWLRFVINWFNCPDTSELLFHLDRTKRITKNFHLEFIKKCNQRVKNMFL